LAEHTRDKARVDIGRSGNISKSDAWRRSWQIALTMRYPTHSGQRGEEVHVKLGVRGSRNWSRVYLVQSSPKG